MKKNVQKNKKQNKIATGKNFIMQETEVKKKTNRLIENAK